MGKRRLLVVDDEPQILEMYTQAFERAGYEVTAADNAEGALKEMGRRSYPVVISDSNMPGMNGVEFCRKIHESWLMTRVIAVTGVSLFELSDCREAGFEAYLIKPVRLKELIAEVEQCFVKHERWRQRLVQND